MPEALANVILDNHPVIRWLMAQGRKIPDSKNFLEGFALCLRQAGIDVTRITTGVPILHPQIFSVGRLDFTGPLSAPSFLALSRETAP